MNESPKHDQRHPKKQPRVSPDLGVGVVGVPGGAQGLLAPDVPHQEARVVHHDLLHVAADGGRGVNHLVHGAAQGKGTGSHPGGPSGEFPIKEPQQTLPGQPRPRFDGEKCRNVNKNSNKKDSLNYIIIKLQS